VESVEDRRVVLAEVTTTGRAALDRVSRAAEAHIAEALSPLDGTSRRRLSAGLLVLRRVFNTPPASNGRRKKAARVRE
jgi:DNA-binding MarR family transcriptional regulator